MSKEKILAIDFGGSSVNVILGTDKRILARRDYAAGAKVFRTESLAKILRVLSSDFGDFDEVVYTGGMSKHLSSHALSAPARWVNEIDAIGRGGLIAARLPKALVVSLGTGTAMVVAREGKKQSACHVGGTGLGGGTIAGLGNLLCGTKNFEALERLAREGDFRNVDLTVQEIVGGPIGIIPADFTAANFGKLARGETKRLSKNDLAAGIINMVGQNVARLAITLASANKVDDIVVIGRVIESKLMQSIVQKIGKLFDEHFVFPSEARYGVAHGALSLASQLKV